MKWIILGLGNPGSEYEGTRHNIGKDFVAAAEEKLPAAAKVVELNVYMNNSGPAVRKLVASQKAAEHLVVVHDDLDLPLGNVKVSFGAGPGGHNGVLSIQKALKTKNFTRVRIGISPSTSTGKLRKPTGEKVTDFVLGKFRPSEKEKLKKVRKTVREALELLVEEGVAKAMTEINSR